jgi:uncharacterized protein (DUF1684 family)
MTNDARPGLSEEPRASLSLLDYRRRVSALYAEIRASDPPAGHALWRRARDELFRSHPQSPFSPETRAMFGALEYYPYDPALRFFATVTPADGAPISLDHSGEGATKARPFGRVAIDVSGATATTLTVYRLDQYGDGVFLPFRDATSGDETYGGGRYLLDTVKGADLGGSEDAIVLDFNFAYHPSCVYDPHWSCPLAPPDNRLAVAIRAGERL